METITAGFLPDRLAAARAIPVERRTPEVKAFIAVCELQTELADALGLPDGRDASSQSIVDERWTCARALKLARSHYLSDGPVLLFSSELHQLAVGQLQLRVLAGRPTLSDCLAQLLEERPSGSVEWPSVEVSLHLGNEGMARLRERLSGGDVATMITGLLGEDVSLDTIAKVAAGLPQIGLEEVVWEKSLSRLALANAAVALLQQPAVRQRLKRELAAVQQQEGWQLLSYNQLLTIFASHATSALAKMWAEAERMGALPAGLFDPLQAEVLQAYASATELLPQLAPDRPYFLKQAAWAMQGLDVIPGPTPVPGAVETCYELLKRARDLAEQQGSDLFVAECGYQLAQVVLFETFAQRDSRPSTVMGWLALADEAAGRVNKSVFLPGMWSHQLRELRRYILPERRWLDQLQQQGDAWRPCSVSILEGIVGRPLEEVFPGSRNASTCTGCGKRAVQLRTCRACKEAKYCR